MGVANIGAGNGVSVAVPIGALVLSVGFQASVAFNGTTATVSAGDGTTTFISAENIKVTTAVAVDVASKYFPNGGTITFTAASGSSDTTAGSGYGWVTYIGEHRQNENQA